jgi:CRP-like cAMP-binding protein
MESLEPLALQNRLLGAIPRSELERLLPHMERLILVPRQILYRQGTPVEYVYFPVTGVLSMIASTLEGDTVEVAAVGREGFTEVTAVLSSPTMRGHQGTPMMVVTQIPGSVLRLKLEVFEAALERNMELNRCVRRYLSVLFTQLVLSVSCNRLHSLEQRCARWLMSCMDRSEYEEIAVTQALLAEMLGVRRQSVDNVLGELESKRMIECLRGSIRINDSKQLSAAACECYRLAKERLENFLA